jgi:hypothetical protein
MAIAQAGASSGYPNGIQLALVSLLAPPFPGPCGLRLGARRPQASSIPHKLPPSKSQEDASNEPRGTRGRTRGRGRRSRSRSGPSG